MRDHQSERGIHGGKAGRAESQSLDAGARAARVAEIPDWDARVAETANVIRIAEESGIPAALTAEEAGKLGGRGKKAIIDVALK